MRMIVVALVIAMLASPAAHSAEPASFSPAALVSHQTTGNHAEFFIAVFPPAGKEFEISLPLIPRWFAYGPSGRSVYATALKETGPRSFTDEPGMFKIELDPVRVNTIRGLDAFGSIGPFAVSRDEDLVVSGGSKDNSYPANSCGVYEIHLPAGDIHAAIETSDCRAGSPWRVLSLSPEKTEALISANRSLALLDLAKGSITKIEGQLSKGSFSPDGKWIAAIQINNPNPPRTILIDRSDLTKRRDLGESEDSEVVWSPDSKFLLHAVYRPACPSQNPLALETLDVETGKRSLITDSICNSGSSRQIGWIRSGIKR
jgi:hypothetical protein